MSRANIEVVRRGYEAFNRGDQEAMVADLAPTFEYLGTGTVAGFSGDYQGGEGWIEAVSWLLDEFNDARVEIRELLDREEKVVAEITLHGSGKRRCSCHLGSMASVDLRRSQGRSRPGIHESRGGSESRWAVELALRTTGSRAVRLSRSSFAR